MPNPLDMVTQDDSDDGLTPFERAITIRPLTDEVHALPSASNQLVQAVAPEAPNELTAGLARLRELVQNYGAGVLDQIGVAGVQPGTERNELKRGRDALLGTGDEPRVQLWPERMLRSGATLPGDVRSGAEPVVDPATGRTSGAVIQRAMDMGGLAGGSTLFAKPGAGTLGSGAMRPGASTLPVEPAPVFYSALEHAATNAAQDTMSPQQWLGYLKNQPGVKAEELAWTGIGDWLGQQKGKVKKQDVQAYLDENKVEIKDVTKSGEFANEAHIQRAIDAESAMQFDMFADEHHRNPTDAEVRQIMEDAEHNVRAAPSDFELDMDANSAKYSSYQLPGGDNYREHLLTLPQKVAKIDPEIMTKLGETNRAHSRFSGEMAVKYGNGWRNKIAGEDATKLQRLEADMQKYREASGSAEQVRLDNTQNYQSSHWDEPNVLAHVRTNDREFHPSAEQYKAGIADVVKDYKGWLDNNGLPEMSMDEVPRSKLKPEQRAELDDFHKRWDEVSKPIKSLHIEEIQSDWHQQGRKQGYRGKEPTPEEIEDKASSYFNNNVGKDETHWGKLSEVEKDKWRNEARTALKDSRTGAGVPDAPFKTSWPELALKRMIRKAAEEGYDRISWTPGEAQAARYDLSKQVSKVYYDPSLQGGTLAAEGLRPGSTVLDKQGIKPEQIADYIGKDAAKKLLETKRDANGHHVLEGVDLKVGGEGMREFYDKMLPKMVEKIGKAHGVKVKQTALVHAPDAPYTIKPFDNGKTFHVIDRHGEVVHATPDKIDAEAFIRDQQGGHNVHYFDLPQSLKDHAVGKGFPLYMSGVPFPLTPVDHDPFADKQLRKSSQKAVMQEIDPGKDWGGRDRNALEPSDVQRSRTHGRAFQQEKP